MANAEQGYIEVSREVADVWVTSTGIYATAPTAIAPALPAPSVKIAVCRSVTLVNSIGESLSLTLTYPNVGEVYSSLAVIEDVTVTNLQDNASFRQSL